MAAASTTVGRGRIAWILAIIVGAILLVVGLATGPNYMLVVIGALFLVIGVVMLIASSVSKGGVD